METTRATPGTFRDDLDRVLIGGSIVVVFFFGSPIALLPALFAAYALVLHREWARIPLAISGLVVAALPIVLAVAGELETGPLDLASVVHVAPGLVISLLAMRVHIGPLEARGPQARQVAPIGEMQAPPGFFRDLADDPPMLQFLDAVAHLERETTRLLAASWKTVAPEDRDRAWRAAREAIGATGRTELLEEVRRQIELWGRSASGSPWTWNYGTMTDVDRSTVRRAAMPAILDAAAAILVRDRLNASDRDLLAGPWEATVVAEAQPA